MVATSFIHGNQVYYDGMEWRYVSDDVSIREPRECPYCGKLPTKEGYDGCLGYLEHVQHACCGHGRVEAEVILDKEHGEELLTLEEYYRRFRGDIVLRMIVRENEEIEHVFEDVNGIKIESSDNKDYLTFQVNESNGIRCNYSINMDNVFSYHYFVVKDE